MISRIAAIIIFSWLSFGTLAAANAQEIFGAKLGGSLSNMIGDAAKSANTDPIFGFAGGPIVVYKLSDQFSLQGELLLIQKGVKRTYTVPVLNGSIDIKETTKITALELPIIAKFPFPKQKSVVPSVYLGSAVSVALSANSKGDFKAAGYTPFPTGSFESKVENVRTLNCEVVIGTDFTFDVGESKLVLDFRYGVSPFGMFSDINDLNSISADKYYIADLNTGEAFELKSESISMNLSVLFTK
jgi:hypothetical protein